MKKYFLAGIIFFLIFSTSLCFAGERAGISVIFSSDAEPYQQSWKGFKKFLDEKKVALRVSKYSLGKKKPGEIYQQINKERPDIVLTLGTRASRFAKEGIKDIPVVFGMVFDPKEFRDQNITGGSLKIPARRKLREIKRILPDAKRIGLIYSPGTISIYKEISKACNKMGLKLVARKVGSQKEFPDAIKDISWQIDCFLMIPDPAIYFPKSVEYLLREGLKAKFPVIGLSSSYTKAGALVSLDCDYNDLGRQVGELTLRILKGERPVKIKSVSPRKIKISLNLTVAERLGIKILPQMIKETNEFFGK